MFLRSIIPASKSSLLNRVGVRSVKVEARLAELGLNLPAVGAPKGNYVSFVKSGNIVFLSGHLPQPFEGPLVLGKVGKDVSQEEAYKAAKIVGLNIIATLKANLGDLDKVKRVIKLVGFVNCVDGFTQQPGVINGCSDLMVEVFGEKGRHARSAVGTNALPLGVPVEIEAIVEIEE